MERYTTERPSDSEIGRLPGMVQSVVSLAGEPAETATRGAADLHYDTVATRSTISGGGRVRPNGRCERPCRPRPDQTRQRTLVRGEQSGSRDKSDDAAHH